MSTKALPVVVVGAGPTGVTAATLLAQGGIEVLLLDQWAEVYPQPRAVHLDDEIYRIIGRLGLAEEFGRISRPCEGLRLQDAQHSVFAEFRRQGGAGINGFPQANMFDQPELEALLRANLRRHPLITFRTDVEVLGVHQPADGPVRVDLIDRSTGQVEMLRARYVLGCDGANSVVRRAIGAEMQDLKFEQRWLVVDVNTNADLAQWEGVHQVCDTDRAGTYMRISDRRYRWEFQLLDGEKSTDFEDPAALMTLIGPWTGTVPAERLEIVRIAEYTFRAQLADRWRDRNVFVLGDAAHLTPPFVGQGMGAGLRDAANLSWKLAGVLNGTLGKEVLDTYQAERRPHARQMIRLAITVGMLMTKGGRVGDALRRLIAPQLHRLPGVRNKVLDSTTPALRRSHLVRRGRWRRGLAGELCPNVFVEGNRRFDEVVNRRFAIVMVEPPKRGEAKPHGGDVVMLKVRPGDPLHTWLAGAEGAVVRPDGTVLAEVRSADKAVYLLGSLGRQVGTPSSDD